MMGGSTEYVIAMHDYAPSPQAATCLSFRAGQVIHVLNRDTSGWWDGELEGRRGWFPSNYVSEETSFAETTFVEDDSDDLTQVPSSKVSYPVTFLLTVLVDSRP
jgi:son of sevenless